MPSRTSQYSDAFNVELRGKTVCILAEAEKPLTASEIISRDISLAGLTTQKMTRTLNDLANFGVIRKHKSGNRMVYMTCELEEKLLGKVSTSASMLAPLPMKKLSWADFDAALEPQKISND